MKTQVRLCNPKDFPAVHKLLRQLWPDKDLDVAGLKHVYDRALSSQNQILTVAVIGDQVVGFCSLTIKNNLWQAGNMGNVDELVVDVTYRGRGIGTLLIENIEMIARQNNCRQIELDSSFHRKEAHQFYESIGFNSRAFLFTKRLTS